MAGLVNFLPSGYQADKSFLVEKNRFGTRVGGKERERKNLSLYGYDTKWLLKEDLIPVSGPVISILVSSSFLIFLGIVFSGQSVPGAPFPFAIVP